MKRRWTALLTLAILLLAFYLVSRVLQQFSIAQIVDSLQRLEPARLAAAMAFAAASYLTLTSFDFLGVRYAGRSLPYPRVALASFTSLSIGHTLGLAPLSSGAVRYRFYAREGFDAFTVATIILFSALTVMIGELSLSSIVLLVFPDLAARIIQTAPGTARLLGFGGVAAIALYVALAVWLRRPLTLWRWTLRWPSWRLALAQIVVGTLNYALVAGALQQALASTATLDYGTVAAAYVLANLATLLSHVPGGLGVIEAVIVMLLPGADVIGGLVAFRVIYFLIPLAIGVLLFGAVELLRWRRSAHPIVSRPATNDAS